MAGRGLWESEDDFRAFMEKGRSIFERDGTRTILHTVQEAVSVMVRPEPK
ncbi:hypothetical protein ACFWV1_08825 [Streptomyces sp. NPDC058700]